MPDLKNFQDDKEYNEWFKKVLDELPEIARRVFALRKKAYVGSGCHYDMEMKLGKLIVFLNDYDRDETARRVLLSVHYPLLITKLKEAETCPI